MTTNKALERTVREQEATILHLRSANTLLAARLAISRKRKNARRKQGK